MGVDPGIDITTEQRETILALLEGHLPDTAAWIYGSRVKWTSRPQSDLDLVVFTTEEQNSQVGALRDAFEESSLPFRVDLFVWDAIPEAFRQQIEAEHIVLTQQEKRYEIDGWRETRLGDVIELKRGYDLPKYKRLPGRVPVVSSSGPTDHHVKSKVEGPGVVTGRYGTLGQVFFIPQDFWPLNTTLYVRDFKRNDRQFIAYFLQGLDFSAYSDKAAVPGLNRNHLHEKIVRFPTDIDEQRAIAHVLGTLDNKIELNRRMNETLEAMAQALFKSWFVEFDPVRAKTAGGDPGLPKHLADLFPDRLVESELGEIPESWVIFHLDELAVQHTKSMSPYAFPEANFEHFSIPAHDKDLLPAIDQGAAIRSNKVIILPNAVLLSKLNPKIDRVWMPDTPNGHLQICSTEFLVFTARSLASRTLLFLLFRDTAFRTMLQSMVTGTSSSHQRVSPKALKRKKVLSGTPLLFERFAELAAPMLARVVKNRAESRNLASLRDTLLPKLLSGKLRVIDNTKADVAREV